MVNHLLIGIVIFGLMGCTSSSKHASKTQPDALVSSPAVVTKTPTMPHASTKSTSSSTMVEETLTVVMPESPSASRKPAMPTHVVTADTEYYQGGPQQGRPPEGRFKKGTEVFLLSEQGSYVVVQSATGITAHVPSSSLAPLSKSTP